MATAAAGRAKSPVRVLLTCRPLTGHFRPLLPLAGALVSAGHDVAFASGEPIASEAEARGFAAFRAGLGESSRELLARRFPDFASLPPSRIRAFFFTELFVRIELEPRANDLTKIVARWAPHLLVHEVAELAGPVVATRRGIPYADHGFGPAVPDDVVRAAGEAAAPYWRPRGLVPHPLGGLYRHLYLDVCPPSLQVAEAVAVGAVQRIRPVETGRGPGTQLAWLDALRDRPIVYVTLGTVWNRNLDVFRTLIDGLGGEALNVVVTVDKQKDPAELGPQPPNVHVHRYIPQALLLPRCAAVVMHGGSGSMLGALAFGLPLLVVPQGADQFSNAERVVAAGAGLRLLPDRLTADSARDAVRALVRDDTFRDAARRIKNEIDAMPDPEQAVAALERLAASGPQRRSR